MNTKRCFVCKKKLSNTLSFVCKCELHLCLSHRFPDSHNCPFDHMMFNKKKLDDNLVKVVAEKISRI